MLRLEIALTMELSAVGIWASQRFSQSRQDRRCGEDRDLLVRNLLCLN